MNTARLLILLGVFFILAGIFWAALSKFPYLGKLPGDIYIKKDHFTFYFPITTCLLISLFIMIFLWIKSKF